jgi:hypothetical protein
MSVKEIDRILVNVVTKPRAVARLRAAPCASRFAACAVLVPKQLPTIRHFIILAVFTIR